MRSPDIAEQNTNFISRGSTWDEFADSDFAYL